MQLDGTVAVVTGASVGIGRQVALDFARSRAVVVGVARSAGPLEELERALQQISSGSWVQVLDVSDALAVDALVRKIVARTGRLDVIVNNAAIEEFRAIRDTTIDDVWRTFRINFGGVVNFTLAGLPIMVKQGSGRIMNVVSGAGRSPIPGDAAYGASKAAVVAFSESISYELEPKGVRVQVLYPGHVKDTRMAIEARRAGQALPPRMVHRTAEQVSRALLRGLDSPNFEINVTRLETFAPIARWLVPRLYRRGVLRTQPLP